MISSTGWRSPQLVRDRKPYRPGYPEDVTKVDRNVAIALLLAKLHNELYEIEMEPRSAEEVADFLTVLHGLFEMLSPVWTAKIGDHGQVGIFGTPLPSFVLIATNIGRDADGAESLGYVGIHSLIERLARDLLSRQSLDDIVYELARCAVSNQVLVDDVIEKFKMKMANVGGFDAHLLWQSTEF